MITNCSTRTVTEVDGDSILISCVADMNEDGTTFPELFQADLLEKSRQINDVNGKEGELLLSYTGSQVGEVDAAGELIIQLDEDNVDNYYVNAEGDLIYNG